jgi:hypothetical protein
MGSMNSDDADVLLPSEGHRFMVTDWGIYNVLFHEFVAVFVFGWDECIGGVVDEGNG